MAMREGASGRAVDRDAVSRRHCFISMVEEPTKTLRGALAFFRGASCQFLVIKICKTRDPIKHDRMIDFATAR
jgi:hypothetical protein